MKKKHDILDMTIYINPMKSLFICVFNRNNKTFI